MIEDIFLFMIYKALEVIQIFGSERTNDKGLKSLNIFTSKIPPAASTLSDDPSDARQNAGGGANAEI